MLLLLLLHSNTASPLLNSMPCAHTAAQLLHHCCRTSLWGSTLCVNHIDTATGAVTRLSPATAAVIATGSSASSSSSSSSSSAKQFTSADVLSVGADGLVLIAASDPSAPGGFGLVKHSSSTSSTSTSGSSSSSDSYSVWPGPALGSAVISR
jgi:hypothetical protein